MNIAILLKDYLDILIKFAKLLPLAIVGLILGWLLIKVIISLLRHAIALAKISPDIRGLIITVVKFLLWTALIFVIVQALGLGSFAIALSGSAVIMVFFLSNSIGPVLSNIFAGLFLVSDPDIKVGMKITTNDGKTTGIIKSLDMRKIRIEDEEGLLHVVPNSVVENTEWIICKNKKNK